MDTSSGQVDIREFQEATVLKGIGKTIVAPFDRVKFLLQSQGELRRLGKIESIYGGVIPCLHRIIHNEGVSSLWRGNMIQVASIMPTIAAQSFLGAPACKATFDVLPHSTPISFTIAAFCSGLVGGLAGSLASYPLDLARYRMACDVKPHAAGRYDFKSSLSFFSHRNMVDNPHLYYRGIGLFIGGSILYRSLFQSMFLLIQPFLPHDDPYQDPPNHFSWRTFLCQTMAFYSIGMLVTLALYPLDTVRKRLMLSLNHEGFQYRNAQQCCKTILRAEGWRGLYRGVLITMIRGGFISIVGTAIGTSI
eukprot:Tbor_TRINITY_DN422_c0_g1::TRINITY_DN422_c0_g1_i1::g.3149::m.3149/K05863/SLC25A4S, ANT; solute carrier family 25 (mitochondrial adenine nucleotide translocator), member 4/5/6/31